MKTTLRTLLRPLILWLDHHAWVGWAVWILLWSFIWAHLPGWCWWVTTAALACILVVWGVRDTLRSRRNGD